MKLLMPLSVIISMLFSISYAFIEIDSMNDAKLLPEVNGDKFYYFGYGSNMLTKRIHIENPTAVKIGAGKLKHYRLDFNSYSNNWDGAPATIVPHWNKTVQGTVWQIDLSKLKDIDHQEGIHEGLYEAKSVPITLVSNHKDLMARVYLLVDQPDTDFESLSAKEISPKRLPSKTYIQCLVKGAIETGLEPLYVDWLRSLKHSNVVKKEMESFLELQSIKLKS